jgi:hypothetical protein
MAKTRAKKGSKGESAPQNTNQPINKTQAVAEAQKELGRKAGTQDVLDFVRQRFGLDITPQYLSVIKSTLKKRRGKQRAAARKQRAAGNGQENGGRRSSRGEAGEAGGGTATLIREVKALAQKVGGLDALRQLAEALAE